MISEKKVQISARQAAMLLITFVLATADVLLPAFVAQEAKADSWISVIWGTIFALAVVNIFITLGLRFPNKTIVEYSCDIVGKPLGKVIGFMYVYLFLFICWAVIRELEEIFVIAFNPDSPILLYGIIAIAVAAYALSKGFEVIARLSEIFIPLGAIILIFIVFVNIPRLDLTKFLPVFYEGIAPSLKGALFIQSWLVQTVILLQFLPFIREKEKVRRYTNISILLLAAMMMTGVLTIAVFGPELTGKILFPALEYVRMASLGKYIQNLDVAIMLVWIAGIFIKICVSYYLGTFAFAQLFHIKNYKNMIIPMGVMLVIFAATTKMLSEVIHLLKYDFPFFVLIFALVIPSILLLISVIRRKKENGPNQAEEIKNQE